MNGRHLLPPSGKSVSPFEVSRMSSACSKIAPVSNYIFALCDGDRRPYVGLTFLELESREF